MVYEPAEDSHLLKRYVEQFAQGSVLDMGSGSGILAKAALNNGTTVLASDIDPEALAVLEKIDGILAIQSDLFENIEGTFDTIIFNPPYLPNHPQTTDITLDGGKAGFEVIERFLSQVIEHLKIRGRILLLFSNLTNKKMVDFLIEKHLLEFEQLEEKPVGFFEKLYVYKIEFSNLFKNLLKQGVTDITYFTRGHRGILFRGKYQNKDVVIKTSLKESHAIDRMANERRYLSLLNQHNIGPKLIAGDKDYIMYNHIDGIRISDYIMKASINDKPAVDSILRSIFDQCRKMDQLMINKEEMHHPFKHILITKDLKPIMIDFERANHTIKPKNTTQFVQFLLTNNLRGRLQAIGYELNRKGLMDAAAMYKHDMSDGNYVKIINLVTSLPATPSS